MTNNIVKQGYDKVAQNYSSQRDQFNVGYKQVTVDFGKQKVKVWHVDAFSQVKIHEPLIMEDDYGRVEVAINMGNFAKKYKVKAGDVCSIYM